jgi:hypothetical protein
MVKGTTTRSPTFSFLLSEPTSTTSPMVSWPRMSPLSMRRHDAVEDVEVGAADGAGRHLDDGIAPMLDLRVRYAFAADVASCRARSALSSGGQTSATNAAPVQLGQADVEAILTGLAAKKGGGGNWKVSIVDLLRLLDLDSSLNARKELASELNVHAGEHGSAEQNIALSKAVWQQLAQNGGKVPDGLKS